MLDTISKPEATATAGNSCDDFETERPKHGRGSRGGRMPGQKRGSRAGPRTSERPRPTTSTTTQSSITKHVISHSHTDSKKPSAVLNKSNNHPPSSIDKNTTTPMDEAFLTAAQADAIIQEFADSAVDDAEIINEATECAQRDMPPTPGFSLPPETWNPSRIPIATTQKKLQKMK
ncbi:hypothetical protein B566_EDAN015382 [Ephemera danica]|nr:hypothetical protein B566_EDAN015382 [Ephemera danica]